MKSLVALLLLSSVAAAADPVLVIRADGYYLLSPDSTALVKLAVIDQRNGNNPTPGPGPVDPVDPVPDLKGLALEAYQKAKPVDRHPGEADAIASVFSTVASKAAALSWDMPTMGAETGKALKPIFNDQDVYKRWEVVRLWMNQQLQSATKPEDAIDVLNQLAAGLGAVD